MKTKKSGIDRRTFIKSVAAGAGFWIAGRGASTLFGTSAWAGEITPAPSDARLNVGFIGVANRAAGDLHDAATSGLVNVVALCDVDATYLGTAAKEYPDAKTYRDYRKLLEQKDIDAVLVATPNHTHAVATAAAIRAGKHVYCEKPLTHTIHEARFITELAAEHKTVTQMGTQIHAGENYRRVVELVKAGAIGKVSEVHVWCDKTWSAAHLPVGEQPVPAGLEYDLWLGPGPAVPYNRDLIPASWRRYTAFGDGTIGDMACHYMDLPFWALDLGQPIHVATEGAEKHEGCWPTWLTATWKFPARGALPPVTLTWYDGTAEPGGKRPPNFADWGLKPELKPENGVMFIGEKGMLFSNYSKHQLLPEKTFADFTPPPPSIPKSLGHHREWAAACIKNDPTATTCHFGYSGVLTEAVLLGNLSYRAGTPIEWDARNLKIPNNPAAEEFLHYQYRKGWTL